MTESDESSPAWMTKQTGISLGLGAVILTFVAIGVERVTKIQTVVSRNAECSQENRDTLRTIHRSMLTRDDVELIVKSQLSDSLLDIYKEVNLLKGRVQALENTIRVPEEQ